MSFLEIEGLHVFVTGAAGGIGSAIVEEFLGMFYVLVLSHRIFWNMEWLYSETNLELSWERNHPVWKQQFLLFPQKLLTYVTIIIRLHHEHFAYRQANRGCSSRLQSHGSRQTPQFTPQHGNSTLHPGGHQR